MMSCRLVSYTNLYFFIGCPNLLETISIMSDISHVDNGMPLTNALEDFLPIKDDIILT